MTIRAVALLAFFAAPLSAHPGHGADGGSHSVIHYLFESPHLLAWGPIFCALAVGGWFWRRRGVKH